MEYLGMRHLTPHARCDCSTKDEDSVWCLLRLEELDVVHPNAGGVEVNASVLQSKVVSLLHLRSVVWQGPGYSMGQSPWRLSIQSKI